MAALECLMPTKKLQTGLWRKFLENSQNPEDFFYNKELDALSLRIVPREEETIVHYIDEHVALLYRPTDYEIIGIRIEGFETSFLPKYAELQKDWRLSASCEGLEDFGDMLITVKKIESEFSNTITNVTSELARKEGFDLPAWPNKNQHKPSRIYA
jgi:hypothetical protein